MSKKNFNFVSSDRPSGVATPFSSVRDIFRTFARGGADKVDRAWGAMFRGYMPK